MIRQGDTISGPGALSLETIEQVKWSYSGETTLQVFGKASFSHTFFYLVPSVSGEDGDTEVGEAKSKQNEGACTEEKIGSRGCMQTGTHGA